MIYIKDLYKVYTQGSEQHAILKGINFTVHEGEYLAIMGVSGSGKTTLLNILGVLLSLEESGGYAKTREKFSGFSVWNSYFTPLLSFFLPNLFVLSATLGKAKSRVTEVMTVLLEDDERKEKFRRLDKVLEVYGRDPEQLIRVLQEAQNIFGYIPEEVQAYISQQMDIPVSEVNGVVTFYALFSTEPKGKYNVNVCMGTACYVQGAQKIYDGFRDQLGLKDNDTTEDMLFTVQNSRCIGACGLAPVITINEDVHGRLKPKDVDRLVSRYKKNEAVGENNEGKELTRPGEYQETTPPKL